MYGTRVCSIPMLRAAPTNNRSAREITGTLMLACRRVASGVPPPEFTTTISTRSFWVSREWTAAVSPGWLR